MKRFVVVSLLFFVAFLSAPRNRVLAGSGQAPADSRAWIKASNKHAQVLLDVLARFGPEGAGQIGVAGLDREITSLTPESLQQLRQASSAALAQLKTLLTAEKDPLVRQDLEILVHSAQNEVRSQQLDEDRLLPYTDVTALVYRGVRSLLDPQVEPERRAASVERLRKYAGMAGNVEPIAIQATKLTRAHLGDPKLLPPARSQVERDLSNGPVLIAGMEKLFEQYNPEGWREPFAKVREQLAAYEQFVRAEILPKARTDFRLPADLYAFQLEQVGVGLAPEPLAKLAHEAFAQIQGEMQRLAPKVAQARGLETTDYRDVIRALKKEQLVGDAILPHYRKRLEDIEAIVREREARHPA